MSEDTKKAKDENDEKQAAYQDVVRSRFDRLTQADLDEVGTDRGKLMDRVTEVYGGERAAHEKGFDKAVADAKNKPQQQRDMTPAQRRHQATRQEQQRIRAASEEGARLREEQRNFPEAISNAAGPAVRDSTGAPLRDINGVPVIQEEGAAAAATPPARAPRQAGQTPEQGAGGRGQ